MTLKFYGREREIGILKREMALVQDGASRLVVVTGRRRVGKTRLILESLASQDMPLIYAFVYQSTSEERNLESFSHAAAAALGLDYPPRFASFEEALEFVFKYTAKRPVTLVFDEFQNFEVVSPSFFEVLQKLWDLNKGSSRLLLVVSGSVTSAMRNIFDDGKAPLYARQSALLYLSPFEPQLVKSIFEDFAPNHSGEDLLALYALTGGVAQYLETMLESRAFTVQAMIERLFESSNQMLTEATMALAAEFKGRTAVYYDILRLIASGVTKRSEIVSRFKEDVSAYLARLETHFRLIERIEPIAQSGGQRSRIRFEIADELLNFWFTFLEPRQRLVEMGRSDQIRRTVLAQFPTWSGRCLERFYRRHFEALGLFTDIGGWWDRKGENEIDLIAVDELSKCIFFAEIKRNPDKISLETLKQKAYAFFQCNAGLAKLDREFLTLSLEELGAEGKLPFTQASGA